MKSKMKEIFLLACAGVVFVLIPLFISQDNPIPVSLPELDANKIAEQEAEQKKIAAEQAARAKERRMFACEVDEDCIIVDKDPCGCLVGPEGVTTINAAYTLDFNSKQKMITKACPEGDPSTEAQCSPNAAARCVENQCKIVY